MSHDGHLVLRDPHGVVLCLESLSRDDMDNNLEVIVYRQSFRKKLFVFFVDKKLNYEC